MAQTSELNSRPPIRLWPGVVAVTLQWLLIFGAPIVAPDLILYGMLGGVSLGLVILLWWLFFSRTPWSERIGAVVLIVVAVFAVSRLVHVSISNGMMGMMLPVFSIPVMCLALVAGVAASRGLPTGPRRAALAGAIVLGCLTLTLVRTGGIKGEGTADLHWRWTPTPEQRLLAQAAREKEAVTLPPAPADKQLPATTSDQPKAPKPAPVLAVAKIPEKINPAPAEAKTGADWSGFRGPERDSVIHGVRIETDWSRSKPVELWRRAIGPGWSSFAVHGDFFYTQEQRGEDELVSCYNLTTGAPVWRHSDATRFWESNGGAGPRGTPTFHNGRIYTFGATGMLNALDARDGTIVWSRNAAADTHKKIPMWGFASSPLVLGDSVIIATAGVLAAYDLATGNPRWIGPDGTSGYSSPQLVTIDGVEQILLLSSSGVTSVAPADGKLLWKTAWEGDGIVQPSVVAGSDVLMGSGSGMNAGNGLRRVAVTHGAAGWGVEERWTSAGLKPYFNDFVVHKGYAFGFDGSILACVDLADGKRKWKGGRYGHGQLILLPDQDVLLVLSEEGELGLVAASPDKFTELARIPAIEGKTWNHPVLAGDVLLARNGEEMAAFRLSLAPR